MRFVKLALISLLVLFLLSTTMGLLFPSKVVVSRSVLIRQSPDSVMAVIGDMTRWRLWMDGVNETGLTVTAGDGKSAPSAASIGTTHIRLVSRDSLQLKTVWEGPSGRSQSSGIAVVPDSSHTITAVHWYFEQELKWYPWERLGSLMNDKIMGPTMEKSLENLKKLTEH